MENQTENPTNPKFNTVGIAQFSKSRKVLLIKLFKNDKVEIVGFINLKHIAELNQGERQIAEILKSEVVESV